MTAAFTPSPIIMGTWQAGKQYWTGIVEADIVRAVETALEQGVTSFDTAEEYGGGESERTLGKALGARRKDAQIFSKVFSDHLRADQVVAACEQSLKNLGTDYLDLYQIHWPAGSWGSDAVPLEETLGAMNRLKEAGKIRAIGVSNFSLAQLEEAVGLAEIFSLQPPYSLFFRHIDREIRPFCEAHDIRILAYSPLGQGVLTGRFRPGHHFDKGDNRRNDLLFQSPHIERAWEALAHLKPIAEAADATLAQLALAWATHRRLTHPIVGVRNAEQMLDAAGAAGLNFTEATMAEIDRIGRIVSDPLMDHVIPWTWEP